jgi:hypothetical protein
MVLRENFWKIRVIALTMEAVRISETFVYVNETIRGYIPEVCNFHARRRENLKSHGMTLVKILFLAYIYGLKFKNKLIA